MSIYYEVAINVKLDLTEREDIREWLKTVNEYKKSKNSTVVKPPKELEDLGVMYLNNDFKDNLSYDINTSDSENVILKVCIGNKNNDNSLTVLILLLSLYVKIGYIYWYDEINYYDLNLKKLSKDISDKGVVIKSSSNDQDDLVYGFLYGDEIKDYYKDILTDEEYKECKSVGYYNIDECIDSKKYLKFYNDFE